MLQNSGDLSDARVSLSVLNVGIADRSLFPFFEFLAFRAWYVVFFMFVMV